MTANKTMLNGFVIEAPEREDEDDVLSFWEGGVKLWWRYLDDDVDKLRFAVKALVRWQARDMDSMCALLEVPTIKGYVVFLAASEGLPVRIALHDARGWVVETEAAVFTTRDIAQRFANKCAPTAVTIGAVR